MYEHYITTCKNGVTNIDIELNNDTQPELTVTVTFAVTTDSLAWITINTDGTVSPAFGGTGTRQDELDKYAEHAVSIWRAITGDTDTTCRYATPDGQEDGAVIDA